jgi:hypothetical protein
MLKNQNIKSSTNLKTIKKIAFGLCILASTTFAQNKYFDAIQLKSSKFYTNSAAILVEIQDADNNQVDALELYTSEYAKNLKDFAVILDASNKVIADLRVKFSDTKMEELKKLVDQLEVVIERSKDSNKKIRKLVRSEE